MEHTTSPQPAPLLSESAAADYLGVSPRFMQKRRYDGDGPPYIRLSHRCVRYDQRDLERWVADRTFASTNREHRRLAIAGGES